MNCLMMIEQMTNLLLSLSAPYGTVLMLQCPFTISEILKYFFRKIHKMQWKIM